MKKAMDDLCKDSFLEICNFLDVRSLRNLRLTSKKFCKWITEKFEVDYTTFINNSLQNDNAIILCPFFDELENVIHTFINNSQGKCTVMSKGYNHEDTPFIDPKFHVRTLFDFSYPHILFFIPQIDRQRKHELQSMIKRGIRISIFVQSICLKKCPEFNMNDYVVHELPFLMSGDSLSKFRLSLYKIERSNDIHLFCKNLKPKIFLGTTYSPEEFDLDPNSNDIIITLCKPYNRQLYFEMKTFKKVVKQPTTITFHVMCTQSLIPIGKMLLTMFSKEGKGICMCEKQKYL